jgi:hypothetical protein
LLKDPDCALENLNRRRKLQQLDSSDNFFEGPEVAMVILGFLFLTICGFHSNKEMPF